MKFLFYSLPCRQVHPEIGSAWWTGSGVLRASALCVPSGKGQTPSALCASLGLGSKRGGGSGISPCGSSHGNLFLRMKEQQKEEPQDRGSKSLAGSNVHSYFGETQKCYCSQTNILTIKLQSNSYTEHFILPIFWMWIYVKILPTELSTTFQYPSCGPVASNKERFVF